MVATLGGLLALPLGLVVLLLPLLATELSRPRDSAWGALVLLLGLVLVTSADRLSGAPMLGVVCAGLLIGRLGVEVGLGRWRQLSEEEQRRLGSLERWSTSFSQLGATLSGATRQLSSTVSGLGSRLPDTAAAGRSRTKRWVRPEAPAAAPAPGQEPPHGQEPAAVQAADPPADPPAADDTAAEAAAAAEQPADRTG